MPYEHPKGDSPGGTAVRETRLVIQTSAHGRVKRQTSGPRGAERELPVRPAEAREAREARVRRFSFSVHSSMLSGFSEMNVYLIALVRHNGYTKLHIFNTHILMSVDTCIIYIMFMVEKLQYC